ncbi:hypothetical protein DMH04_00150 [Kibdelosporangium aridum]|uniref:Uncharacterized protein n=1 Tax=Kibdelosporangium aridum TaxID=2030 RepID=A0A428ZTR7_KIBAR|nr:hypothetical protein [Kibdelosporangium aridum]RSM91460.1 hypothetical protein DMH04_00150 [Kibdelosporangium aridum]
MCAEELANRQNRTTTSVQPASHAPDLPTDEELSTVADPAKVLLGLARDRGPHRNAVLDHVLRSTYMTDDLAWRLPIQDLERHPVYGPRLAAEISKLCGTSTRRWQTFAESWAQPTQLLASSLFKRLEQADSN